MNRFEHLVHTARRDEGELSVDRFGELWAQSQDELLGDSVEVTEGYRSWWSYVPHFIASPGYVYAYAYGQLLALAVYGRYEEEGPGSRPPTSSCCAPAARARPRSWARSSASTSPTRASGTRAWTSWSASSTPPSRRRARPAACSELLDVLRGPDSARLFVSSMVARTPAAAMGLVIVLRTKELTGSFAAGGLGVGRRTRSPSAVCSPVLGRLVDRRGQTLVLVGGRAGRARSRCCAFAALPHGRVAGGDPAVRGRRRRGAAAARRVPADALAGAAGLGGARARGVRAGVGRAGDDLHRRAGADRGGDRRVVAGRVGGDLRGAAGGRDAGLRLTPAVAGVAAAAAHRGVARRRAAGARRADARRSSSC